MGRDEGGKFCSFVRLMVCCFRCHKNWIISEKWVNIYGFLIRYCVGFRIFNAILKCFVNRKISSFKIKRFSSLMTPIFWKSVEHAYITSSPTDFQTTRFTDYQKLKHDPINSFSPQKTIKRRTPNNIKKFLGVFLLFWINLLVSKKKVDIRMEWNNFWI